VSSAEENKAIFRRYIEEVPNQGNLEAVDEIFDRYLAHQPDGFILKLRRVESASLAHLLRPLSWNSIA
jgi:hypothetical protein